MPQDTVTIDGLAIDTIVGLYDWERTAPQRLEVSLSIGVDLDAAGRTDTLTGSVDYGGLAEQIHAHVVAAQRETIEAVARDVAGLALKSADASSVRVDVRKPDAVRRARYVAVSVERTREELLGDVLVALGSNRDAEPEFAEAMGVLRALGEVVDVSCAYRSEDIGGGGSHYFNAVAHLRTTLPHRELKRCLKAHEASAGRVSGRPEVPIDLDIVLMDGVAHPDLAAHAHVLVPAADVAPEFEHPETGERLVRAAAAIDARGLTRAWRTA